MLEILRSLLLVYATRKIWNVSATASFERGEGSRISLQDIRLQHRFIPDLIRFIEVSSWTVTYSTKLEAATIETFPSVYRDSKLFILPSVLRKKIEVLKRDGKHRLYTYITRCTRVLEDWWGMVDSEQDVNRIIVRRTREKKMYTDIKSVLSSCSYLTEIGIPLFRYRSTMLLIKNCVSIFRSKFLNVFSRNVYL